MNYIVFNKDGSVKNIDFANIIVKGSNNVDEIAVAIDGYDNDSFTANANFLLPDGDSNQLNITTPYSLNLDGSIYQGYVFALTSAQTAIEGNVIMSIELTNANQKKYTYQVILTINPSVPDPDSVITNAEYQNLDAKFSNYQLKYTIHNARFYTSVTDANNDIANIVTNQCVIIADVTNPDSIPTVWFKNASGTLQALNTFSQMVVINAVATSHSLLPTDNPSVDVSVTTIDKSHYQLNFSFGIPKGEKGDEGEKGATGDPAGFGSITASVVANNPDNPPRVEVVTDPTSPNTAKSFQFNFYDIKGEKGDNGDDGTSFVITGEVASISGLPNPNDTPLGTAYFVGTQNPKNVYVCLEANGEKTWVDEGDLEGPQGEPGEKGDTGATGPAPTVEAVAGAHINETGTPSVLVTQQGNVATLTFDYLKGAQGQQGGQGEQGEKGDKGDTGNGIERMTADQSGELYVEYTDGTTQDVGMIGQGVVVVDSQFDENSTNPLQNKVITERWKEIDSASVDVLDYSMAKVSGKDDGLALPEESQLELKALRGNTVAWNQLVQNGNFASTDNWTPSDSGITRSVSNNVLHAEFSSNYRYIYQNVPSINGHKYLCCGEYRALQGVLSNYYGSYGFQISSSTWTSSYAIIDGTGSNIEIDVLRRGSSDLDTVIGEARSVSFIDLTKTFGAGNEPTLTTDPKAQWAINYALKHPANDAGSLVSVDMSAYETEGFNQWDEEWEVGGYDLNGAPMTYSTTIRSKSTNYIKVIPNTTYYAKTSGSRIYICAYDANHNFIGYVPTSAGFVDWAFEVPSNCHYLRFQMSSGYGTTYNHDICINISDTSLNGTYKPYEKNSYPISFHGKSAGNAYDERKADGTDIVRVGNYTFTGNESWGSFGSGYVATIGSLGAVGIGGSIVPQMISTTGLEVVNRDTIYSGGSGISINSDNIYVSNSSNLTGKTIYFELATPVQSVNDPLPNAIKVYQDGTEWQINDGAPCGMEKNYDVSIKGQVITNVRVDARQEEEIKELAEDKQDTLVSGTNIKTINNNSILGSGNIDTQLYEHIFTDPNNNRNLISFVTPSSTPWGNKTGQQLIGIFMDRNAPYKYISAFTHPDVAFGWVPLLNLYQKVDSEVGFVVGAVFIDADASVVLATQQMGDISSTFTESVVAL